MWRNWNTRWIQDPVALGYEGSNPFTGIRRNNVQTRSKTMVYKGTTITPCQYVCVAMDLAKNMTGYAVRIFDNTITILQVEKLYVHEADVTLALFNSYKLRRNNSVTSIE